MAHHIQASDTMRKENIDLNKVIGTNSYKLSEKFEKKEVMMQLLDKQVVCYGKPILEDEYFTLASNMGPTDSIITYICDSSKVFFSHERKYFEE